MGVRETLRREERGEREKGVKANRRYGSWV